MSSIFNNNVYCHFKIRTIVCLLSQVAREKGINPDSDGAKDIKRDIHDYELKSMEKAEKDTLYEDVPALRKKMSEWIDEPK